MFSLKTKTSCIDNPYLEHFKKFNSDKYEVEFITKRDKAVKEFAWAIPNQKALELLVDYSPLIEMGAGTGYWASLVQQMGGEIISYDIKPYKNEQANGQFTKVLKGGPEVLKKYPNYNLFLCWPPYNDPMAFECLNTFTGRYLIYVGEGGGGCNGDNKFWELLCSDYKEIKIIHIPQWCCINDYLTVWKAK